MKYFSFCTALFFLVIAFACWQDPASSTSTAPAAAPEKMFSHTPGAIDDKLTYIPGERFGKLSGITLEGDLEFLYGEEIKPAVIDLGEGFTVAGYRLFPGTENEADIIFPNEEYGIEKLTVTISKKGAEWRMPNSPLAVGTPLKDVGKINEKPFKFLGYEWDYGGLVSDWNGGKLAGIGATLSYPEITDGEMLPDEMMGDTEVSSANPLLEGMGVFVREIVVDLDAPVISEDGIPAETNFAIVPGYRFGAMTANVTPEDLPYVYGVGNVEPMEYDLDGGVSVPGFRIFPGTENEVEIGFPDENNYLEAVEFRISKEGGGWHIAGTDIGIGDRLKDVRAANEAPFLIYDHNMEGGGRVVSWENGRLTGTGLQFETTKDGRNYKYDAEHKVSSDTEAVRESDPQVMAIIVSLER